MRKVLCTILAGVMTASLLAGCGGGGSDQGNSTKGSSGEAGGSQAINIGINTDVSSLDPFFICHQTYLQQSGAFNG